MFEVKKVECDMHQQDGLAGFYGDKWKEKFESLVDAPDIYAIWKHVAHFTSHCNGSECKETLSAMLVHVEMITREGTSPSSVSSY